MICFEIGFIVFTRLTLKGKCMEITLNAFYTLVIAVLVLLLGRVLVNKINFLQRYSIPEAVAGGLVASVIGSLLFVFAEISFNYHGDLRTALMLMFFTSVGLSANFNRLKEGGAALVIFLIVVSVFIVVQNAVGVGMATVLGLDPLIGLVAGSITLTGGHGTAGSWGGTLEQTYGLDHATLLGMASATFGLVAGGIIGGPLANFIIKRHNLASPKSQEQLAEDKKEQNSGTTAEEIDSSTEYVAFENPKQVRLITTENAITVLGLFALCLAFGDFMTNTFKGTDTMLAKLPTFVWCLISGVIVRSVLENVFKVKVFDRAVDVFGNVALSLYLAMSLVALKLWQLWDLALPLLAILTAQTIVMLLYAYFVTFRIMGKDYDAAVLAAGHCGFGMGATPTAVANMQSITSRFGPSHKAFLIVPLSGAFLVDLVNLAAITGAIDLIR